MFFPSVSELQRFMNLYSPFFPKGSGGLTNVPLLDGQSVVTMGVGRGVEVADVGLPDVEVLAVLDVELRELPSDLQTEYRHPFNNMLAFNIPSCRGRLRACSRVIIAPSHSHRPTNSAANRSTNDNKTN